MTQQDIEKILDMATKALNSAKLACTSQSRADVTAAKGEVNEALNGLDSLSTFYDNIVKQYQGKRDQIDDNRKALSRAVDSLKDAYYLLRDEENRNLPRGS